MTWPPKGGNVIYSTVSPPVPPSIRNPVGQPSWGEGVWEGAKLYRIVLERPLRITIFLFQATKGVMVLLGLVMTPHQVMQPMLMFR